MYLVFSLSLSLSLSLCVDVQLIFCACSTNENWIDFNRSDIAWKDAKYAQIWEYLSDEFELTQRFASLDFKLKFVEVKFFSHPRLFYINHQGIWSFFKLICILWQHLVFYLQHNIRFLQEILQNRKSDFLEWLIIALIGAEILLSVYDIVHRSSINL